VNLKIFWLHRGGDKRCGGDAVQRGKELGVTEKMLVLRESGWRKKLRARYQGLRRGVQARVPTCSDFSRVSYLKREGESARAVVDAGTDEGAS